MLNSLTLWHGSSLAATCLLLAGCGDPFGLAAPAPLSTLEPFSAPAAGPAVAPAEPSYQLDAVALTVTASATSTTYVAARAVDGNSDTEWQAPGASAPTLTVDRGVGGGLAAIAVKVKPGQPFTLQLSDDGLSYRTALATSTATWSLETKTLPAGTSGRYVRLAFPVTSGNVMVFEVQPQAAASTPAPSMAPTKAPSAAPTAVPTAAPSKAPSAAPTVAPSAAPSAAPALIATRFGNQSVPKAADGTLTRGYQLMTELGMKTVREGWNWKNIETGNGTYVSWMSFFDGLANQFVAQGDKAQAMVCDTPAWASSNGTPYGVPNGLAQAIFADGTDVYKPGVGPNRANPFAGYMWDMVTRYKGKIAYWQVWNEPDYPSGDLGAGTIGSSGASRYWDGSVQDYVRLLKVAATVVRGVDPAAKITLGGIGYEGYLGAILDNGGAPYFDVVDFHAYGTDKTSSNGVLNSAWGFLGRYNALKAMLKTHGVSKTFSCSETGFTADNAPEQANYVAKVFATGLGLGDLEMVQWAVFTNPGFNDIGLIDGATLSLKTAGYTAYAAATKQLAGCVPTGTLAGTNVQGYSFKRTDGKTLWVAWSTAASASLSLPFVPASVVNVQGQAHAVTGSSLSLTTSPLYIISP